MNSTLRRILALGALALSGFSGTAAFASSSGLVISQVHGGGGNSGANYKYDFVEPFNASAAPINLAGYSVQYASAAGTSWQVTPLAGTIPPSTRALSPAPAAASISNGTSAA